MTSREKIDRVPIAKDDEKWVKDLKKRQNQMTKEYITDAAVDDLLKLRKKNSGGRPVPGDLSVIITKYHSKNYNFVTKGYLKYRLGIRMKKEQNKPPPLPKTIIVINSNDSVISGLSLPPAGQKRVASAMNSDDEDEDDGSKRLRPNIVGVDDGLYMSVKTKKGVDVDDKFNHKTNQGAENDVDDELIETVKTIIEEDAGNKNPNETNKNDTEYRKKEWDAYDRLLKIASMVTVKDWEEYQTTGDEKKLEDIIASRMQTATANEDNDDDDDDDAETIQLAKVSKEDVDDDDETKHAAKTNSAVDERPKSNNNDIDDSFIYAAKISIDDDDDDGKKPAATADTDENDETKPATIKKLNLTGVSKTVKLELGLMQAALTYAHLRLQFEQVGRRMPKGQLNEIVDFAETQNELPPGSLSKRTFVARANKRRWSKTIPTSELIPMLRKSGSFPLITASYG